MFQKENKDMPFGWAVFCLAFLFVSMIGSVVFKMNIPTHINLLASISITLLVAWLNGKPWSELEEAIQYGGKICISPTVIMMLVGVLIASWIASGTVPTIIYWGLKLINPSFFLVTASLLCAIVAIAIVVLAYIGAYAISNSVVDIWMVVIFGFVGFFGGRVGWDTGAMALGVILGPMIEDNLGSCVQLALATDGGLTAVMFGGMINKVLILALILSLLTPFFLTWKKRRADAARTAGGG